MADPERGGAHAQMVVFDWWQTALLALALLLALQFALALPLGIHLVAVAARLLAVAVTLTALARTGPKQGGARGRKGEDEQ